MTYLEIIALLVNESERLSRKQRVIELIDSQFARNAYLGVAALLENDYAWGDDYPYWSPIDDSETTTIERLSNADGEPVNHRDSEEGTPS